MTRDVIVLNNYDLDRVDGEVSRGDKPAHHLFGVDVLRRQGWRTTTIPQHSGPRWIRCIERLLGFLRCPIPCGDLGQQWQAWRLANQADVIYAPCQTQTHLLAYLRALGLLHTPLVVIAHHPPLHGRLAWLRRCFFRSEIAGVDLFPSLSSAVAKDIATLARSRGTYSPVLRWGPDLDYYNRFATTSGPGKTAMGAGRTGRDWVTFGRGAARANVPACIFCLSSDLRSEFATFPANVEIRPVSREEDLRYPQLLPSLATARVLAIPLAPGQALAGLTSVTDALGLGKPMIITRHPLLDLNVENAGIGFLVEPGDVEGWERALRWFEDNPESADAMGRRARAMAETTWNYRAFATQIIGLLEATVQARQRKIPVI